MRLDELRQLNTLLTDAAGPGDVFLHRGRDGVALRERFPRGISPEHVIGRCLLFLLGGDLASGAMPATVDDRLQRVVRSMTRPSPLQRAQDAWDMYGELERVRKAIYGEHRFQEFVV